MRWNCLPTLPLLVFALFPVSGAAAPAVEVVNSGANRVVLSIRFDNPQVRDIEIDGQPCHRVLVDGCIPNTEVGHPQVPVRGMLVGIPFGVEPRVRVIEVEEGGRIPGLRIPPAPRHEPRRDGERVRAIPVREPDRAIYGRQGLYPDDWVREGWVATLRFQRVVQVLVFPFRWEPGEGGTWARQVTVEVTWEGGIGDKELGFAAGEPLWEGMYRRLVANHESARSWRRSPAPVPDAKDSPPREDEHQLRIAETGLYEIRYEDLRGLSVAFPTEELGVYRKIYDEQGNRPWEEEPIPIHLLDEDRDSLFGPGDRFYFWARSFRDAFGEFGYEDRYSAENVYWVGRGPAGGARMDTARVWRGAVAGTLRTFPEVLHFEEETHYWAQPQGPDRDGVPPECDVEQWFWTNWRAHEVSLGITVHDVNSSLASGIRARFQGSQMGTHIFHLGLTSGIGASTEPDSFSFQSYSSYIYESDTLIPAGFLTEGENFLEYKGWLLVGSTQGERSGAFLDWVEISYDRHLRARDDYLVFSAPEDSGSWGLEVAGFTREDVHMFDVSEAGREMWMQLPAGAVVPDGGGYRLVFQDSLTSSRNWVAITGGSARRLPSEDIVEYHPASIFDAEGDYVVICHPLFFDGIEPLVSHREAQGFEVRIAGIMDVYDEFSGGIKNPVAIKRYLQWGFEHWTTKPQFVLLVGDASEDHLGVYPESEPDFVPSIAGCSGNELAAMDNWYVRFDDDLILDAYLGRLPAGSRAELDAVVEKILAYEEISADDAWRGRVLLVSDDQCSGFNPYQCGHSTEEIFEEAARVSAEIVQRSPGAPLQVREILLADYTGRTLEDGFHGVCSEGGIGAGSLACVKDSVRARVTPLVFDALNEGVLLFSFQGHGHPNIMFDEHLLVDSVAVTSGQWRSDLTQYSANDGRPYFVHGFGCQFGDFDRVEESSPYVQDCMLEKMLFLPRGGAVAALGSSGVETITVSTAYQEFLYRAFFEEPPVGVDAGGASHARWLLGEVQAAAVANLAASQYGGSFLTRYVLLGDPALRMDALPPAMEAFVDGAPVENGAVILGSNSPTVNVRVRVGDEVAVDSTSIVVRILDGDTETVLTPGVDYHVLRDSTTADARVLIVEYPHDLRLANYELAFDAKDLSGRPVSLRLRVRFSFQAWFDGRHAVDGSYVRPGVDGILEVHLPRSVSDGNFSVRLEGPGGSVILPAEAESLDETGARWRVTFSLETMDPGLYDLVLTAASLEGILMTLGVADRLRIDSVTAYPSPFGERTGFSFELSRAATVRIRIFTVAGRLINTLEPDGVTDYNYVPWDGRDEDGEDVANGVYLYQIAAKAGEEAVTSEIGKIVRMK